MGAINKPAKMTYTQFYKLPVGCYFWRENDLNKYFKSSEENVIYLSDNINEQFDKKVPLQELILLSPSICGNCFSSLGGWPPEVICSSCGNIDEDRKDFEKLVQNVSKWTGNLAPHI